MKKLKMNGKLSLSKETVVTLNPVQMKNLNGGDPALFHSRLFCSKNCATTSEYGCPGWSGQMVTCESGCQPGGGTNV